MTNESRHIGRRVLLRLFGGFALVIVLLVGALHIPALQTSVIRTVLNRVQPAGDSNITLGRSSGSPFNRLTLTDLALRTPGDSTSIRVDSLVVGLNPFELLGSTIRLSRVDVRGISFEISTRADGGLVLPRLDSSTETAPDTTAGTGFALDRFDIQRVEGRIGQASEPSFELDAFHLTGGALEIGESLSIRVDTLGSTFRSGDSPTGRLRLGAELGQDGRLRVDGELSTSRSDVIIAGTARYAPNVSPGSADGDGDEEQTTSSPDLPVVDLDAIVRAAPLSYADLKPFLPGLNADRELQIDLEAVGDASDLAFNLSARDDLDGRIEGNGSLHSTTDSVAVTATLQIAQFDGTNHTVSGATLPSITSADLSAALSGTTWNRLDGRIRLDAQRLLAADFIVDSLRLDALLDAGIAQYRTTLRSGSAGISLDGRARPLGTQRFADFDGSFEGITESVGRSAGANAQNDSTGFLLNGSIAGRLDFARSAADSTLLTGELTTVLTESRLAGCESVDGQTRLEIAPGRASVQAGLSACRTGAREDPDGGNADTRNREGVTLGASLDLDDAVRSWTARLQTEGFDLSPFLAMEDVLTFGGSVDASGTAPDAGNVTFEANVDLENLRAAGAALDGLSGRLSGRLSGTSSGTSSGSSTTVLVDVLAAEQDGRMSVRGTLDLAERTSFELDRVSFSRFNATRAAGIPDQVVILSGMMSGTLHLPAAERPEALPDVDLTLSLDSTIVNGTTFESISGSLRTRGPSITADIEALARASRFIVEGTADLRGDSLRSAQGRVDFGGLDVGSLLAIDGISTRLSGSAEGSFDMDRSPRLRAGLNLEEGSTLNRFELDALDARLDGSLERLGGDIRLRGASADMDASFGYSGSRLFVDGRAANIPVHELLGDTTNTLILSTNLVLNASADSAGWNTMTVDLDSLRGRWNTFDVNTGIIRADVTPDRAIVDTFLVQGEFGRIRVSGVTPLSPSGPASNLRLELESDASLASIPVMSELGIGLSSLEAQGALRGPFERRRLNLSIDGSGLRFGKYAVTSLDGRVLAEIDGENSLRSAEFTTSTGVIDLGTMQVQTIEATTAFDGTNVDASIDATIDDERNVSVGATWYRDISPQVIEFNRLRAQLQGDRWQLAGPSRLTLGDNPRLDGLVWYSDSQRIVITSSERSGFVQQFATIDSFKVDAVADLLGFHGLGGRLSGVFSTARQDSSTILQGNANALITAFGRDVGQMNGRLSLTETGLQLLGSMTHETGKQITVSGTVPPTGASEQLRVRADADGFPIAWVRAFLDPDLISELGGAIEGQVEIDGTADSPDWSGSLTLTDGLVGIPELGRAGRSLRYSNIRASVDFERDSLRVTEFTANSGSGRVTGDGSAILSRFNFDDFNLDFSADNFLAINNESYRAVVNGSGRLRGSLERPVFSGDITVPSADFYLNDETTADAFEPVTLSDEHLRTLWERFGVRISAADTSSFDFYRAMKIEDLRVRIERDTWVRSKSNPEMDIQITGDLDVSKEHNSQEASVFGTIQVLPARSRIIQFGRRFDLTTGTLTFNGPAESPRMDLQAEYDVPSRQAQTSEVTIRLVVTGTPQDLEVEFQSDPQMELADIVSYIATGRPASESLQIGQNQSGTYLQSAAGIAMGQVRDLIQDLAGQNLGLDVIEITQNGTQGMTVTAGKYVTPEFYVAVSQPLSVGSGSERSGSTAESTTQVAMEYEIVQQLLLSLMNRGTILRVTLRWEYAF